MAKLVVKLNGEPVTKITLEEGQEYIAGRSNDAQVQLPEARGISRHHLKLTQENGVWICQSLSRFILMQKGAESCEMIVLDGDTVFSVPPFEFHFFLDNAENQPEHETPQSKNLPALQMSHEEADPLFEHTSPRANNEATMAGLVKLVPYIRISHPNTADDEVLKLEGHLWSAGRDPSCEIPLDNPQVSRKHFEVTHTNEGYFITDLGSSNGTSLNGQRLPPHEPTKIMSGDEIRVLNINLTFEVRDLQFSNRLENLPVPALDPLLSMPPATWVQSDLSQLPDELTAIRHSPGREKRRSKKFDWKKQKVRIALVGIIVVIAAVGLMPGKQKDATQRDPAAANNSPVFENLTPEQKSTVKDAFGLSRNLYVQGKYELCLTELAKVHELIPQYENSRELQSFCEQGRELAQRQRDLERKERERAMIEQQLTAYVESCKQKLDTYATVDETRQCLADAIELDPEHHLITEMIHSAQMREEEKKFLQKQKAALEKKVADGEAHYQRAKDTWKDGHLAKAIEIYEKFLATSYPRVDAKKEIARRELSSIKKKLKEKVDFFYDQCKTLGSKNRYKEAWEACNKAIGEDPSNDAIKDYREKMHGELKREMKSIYEDSVLEESLGNVDSAKEKWQRIVKEDLPFDDYSKKAKSKLRKYGADE